MTNQLIKFLLTNDSTLYRGDLDDAIYNLSRAGSGVIGELAEDYYANRFNTQKLGGNAVGADLDDGTEVKAARRSYSKKDSCINISGLKNKATASRIVMIWEDQNIGKICELIVYPHELRQDKNGKLKDQQKINPGFLAKFGDRVKTLAEYDV